VISKGVAEKEEKYEENKINFDVTYLRNSLADSARIWNLRCPTLRKFAQKFFFRE